MRQHGIAKELEISKHVIQVTQKKEKKNMLMLGAFGIWTRLVDIRNETKEIKAGDVISIQAKLTTRQRIDKSGFTSEIPIHPVSHH